MDPPVPLSMNDLIIQLESRENLMHLIDLICVANNIVEPSSTDIRDIVSFLKKINSSKLLEQTGSIEAANASLVESYQTHLNTTKSLADEYNEMNKFVMKVINMSGDDSGSFSSDSQAFKNREGLEPSGKLSSNGKLSSDNFTSFSQLSNQAKIDITKMINYKSLWRESYIIIDSRYQNMVNIDPTQMAFSLVTSTKVRTDHGGVIVGETIRDIVEIQVYSFNIPYNPIFDNFYKQITMTINEWTGSAFEAYEQGSFHFVFDIVKIENNLIYLKPVNDIYSFSKPVNYIDNFTLSFGAMLPKISFDTDRMYIDTIDYTSTDGIITFASEHKLLTGDLVYITNFSSYDTATDVDIINEVNRSNGHIIVKKDNFSIIINVDLSPMNREDPVGSGIYPILLFSQPTVLVYFASKRMLIPMCIRYLMSPELV